MKLKYFSLVEFHDIDLVRITLLYYFAEFHDKEGQMTVIVCFIGHRTVADIEKIKNRLIDVVLTLIDKGADIFLFGSRSDFNSLCWEVITELKEKYPNIKRVCYNAPHETAFTSKEERESCERLFSQMTKREVHFADYEQAVNSQKALKANKNAYIMRNLAMIDASDVCVFYYDKNYKPPVHKAKNKHLPDHQPKSGTATAFAYATQKKKQIINLYE